MSKMGTAAVHTTLAGGQGAHAGSQGGPRRWPRYDIWRERFREGDTYGKRQKEWNNEKSKNRDSVVFLFLLDTGQKVVLGFGELQVFGYLSSPSFFILDYPSIVF